MWEAGKKKILKILKEIKIEIERKTKEGGKIGRKSRGENKKKYAKILKIFM